MKLNKPISIRLEESVYKQLQEMADESNRTISSIARMCVIASIENCRAGKGEARKARRVLKNSFS